MKSLFARIKHTGKLHVEAKEGAPAESEPSSPTQQKRILELKVLLANGSPLHSDKGFIAAMDALRAFIAVPPDMSRQGQALEKNRQDLLAVAKEQANAFVAAVSSHITDLLLTDMVLIQPPAIVLLLTTSVARGGLRGIFPVLSFLVLGASEAEAINQAFSIPLVPVLTKVLNVHLEDNADVGSAIEEISKFVSGVSRFKNTAELMQLEWRSLFPQESLSCADFLFASLGNNSTRPRHQLHCLQVLQSLVGGVAQRRRQEYKNDKPVMDGSLLLTTFQSKHIILRMVGLALNAYDSYSSNPPLLRTLLWRLFGLAEQLMQADQYAPLFGVSEEFERASGYQLLGSAILRIGELDTDTKQVDDTLQGISFISRDRAISKLLRLTQSLIFISRSATPVDTTDFLIRNSTAFGILQRVFIDTQSSWLGLEVLNSMQFIISMHAANRQFVDEARTLPIFLAMYPSLCLERQQVVLKLLEAMLQGGVVPSKALEALTAIFLESLNQNTLETSFSTLELVDEGNEILNLERMRRSRRRKARLDAGGVKCILRFVSNMVRNEIESGGQSVNFARLLRKVGFVGAIFAQISSFVHSEVPEFIPPKGLPNLSSPLAEHVSLLSDLDCYSAAVQTLTLLMPKVDRLWGECGLSIMLKTLDSSYASASLPLFWHFFRSGSARGLLLAIEHGGNQGLKLQAEILSSVLQQLVVESAAPHKVQLMSPTSVSSFNISAHTATSDARFSATWIEQDGVKTLFEVLSKSEGLWPRRWLVVSLCIRIFGMQLIMDPESLTRADFLQMGRQIAASGILGSSYDVATVRSLMDLAFGLNTLFHHDSPVELLPLSALVIQRPRVLLCVIHLLPHCPEELRLRVLNLLVSFSVTKSNLKFYRNCEALASILAINELLDVLDDHVRAALLRFCKSEGKEAQLSSFDDSIVTFIVDVASHRISPLELSKLKSILGIYAPVFFLHIQRHHYSYLNRVNEQSVSVIEFEFHSVRSATVSLPSIPELAWPDNAVSVSIWFNIRHYGREKPEDAGLSPEAGIEIVEFFIAETAEETPDPAYKVTLRNRRLCIRVKNENCIFDVAIQPEKWYFITFSHRRGRMLKSAELSVSINGEVMDAIKCPWPYAAEEAGDLAPSSGNRLRNSLRPAPPPPLATKEKRSTFTSMLSKDTRLSPNVQVVFGSHAHPSLAGYNSVWWLGSVLVYRGVFDPSYISAMYAHGAGFHSSLHPKRTLPVVNEESETIFTIGSRKFGTNQTLAQFEKEMSLDPGKIVLAFYPQHRKEMDGVRFMGGTVELRSVPISDACRSLYGVGMILPLLSEMLESDKSESKAYLQDYSSHLYATLLFLQALLFRNPKNLQSMTLGQSRYALIAHFLKNQGTPTRFDSRIPALFCAIACGAPARPLDVGTGTRGLLARMVTEQDHQHGFLNRFVIQHFIFDWALWKQAPLETQRSLLESVLWLIEGGPTLEKWRKQVTDSLFRNITFYADGFNWNFCFAYPAAARAAKLPPDTALWRAERMRQLGIVPFILEVMTTSLQTGAEATACLMPIVRDIVLTVIRSFIGNRDIRVIFAFIIRGCLPQGFLLRTGERLESSPMVNFVTCFLDAMTKAISEATNTNKREWAENVVQHFDSHFLTYLIFPHIPPQIAIAAFQLLNTMLSVETKDESNGRKLTVTKRGFTARFEAADGLKTIRFLVPVTEGDHSSCWTIYSMIFSRLLLRTDSSLPLFTMFKEQFLFTQGDRSWHLPCGIKDILALLDLMAGSSDLTTKITAHRLSTFPLIHVLLGLFRDRTFEAGNRLKQWNDDNLHFTDMLLDFPLQAKPIAFLSTPGASPDASAILFTLFLFSNFASFRHGFMANISSHLLLLILCAKLGEMHSALTEDLLQDHRWRVLQACSSAAWTTIIGLTRDVVLHGNTPKFHVKAESKKQFNLFSRRTHMSDGIDSSLVPSFVCDHFVDALFDCVGTDLSYQLQSRVLIAVLETCEFLLKRDFSTGIDEVFNFSLFAKKLCSRPECTSVLSLDWTCGEVFLDFLLQILRQVDRFIGISELEKSDRSFLTLIRKDLHQSLAQWCMACLIVSPSAPDQVNVRANRLLAVLKKLLQPGNFMLLFTFDVLESDIQTILLTEMCTHISFWIRKGWWLLRTVPESSRQELRRHEKNEPELDDNMLPIKPPKRTPPPTPTGGPLFPGLKSIELLQKEEQTDAPIKPPKQSDFWRDVSPSRPRNRDVETSMNFPNAPLVSPRSAVLLNSPRSFVPPTSPRAFDSPTSSHLAPPIPSATPLSVEQTLVDSCCELWRLLIQFFGANLCSILTRDSGGSYGLSKDALLLSKTGIALLVQDSDDTVDLLKQQVSFWTVTPCSFDACRKGTTKQADYFAYLSHLIFTLDVQSVRNHTLARAHMEEIPRSQRAGDTSMSPMIVARSAFLEKVQQSFIRNVDQQAQKSLMQKDEMHKKWQQIELEMKRAQKIWGAEREHGEAAIQEQWRCLELSEGPLRQISKLRDYPELYEQYGLNLDFIRDLEKSSHQLKLNDLFAERVEVKEFANGEAKRTRPPPPPPASSSSSSSSSGLTTKQAENPRVSLIITPAESENSSDSEPRNSNTPWQVISVEESIRRHSKSFPARSSEVQNIGIALIDQHDESSSIVPPISRDRSPTVTQGLGISTPKEASSPTSGTSSLTTSSPVSPAVKPKNIPLADFLVANKPTIVVDSVSAAPGTKLHESKRFTSSLAGPWQLTRSDSVRRSTVHLDEGNDDSGDDLDLDEGPAWRILRSLVDDSISNKDITSCERIDGLETRSAILVLGPRQFYVVDDFVLKNDSLEQLPSPQQRFAFEVSASFGDLDNAIDRDTGREWFPATPVSSGVILHVIKSAETVEPPTLSREVKVWSYLNLRDACRRCYLFQDLALELFDRDGKSLFLVMQSTKERESIFSRLNAIIDKNSERDVQNDVQTRLGRSVVFRSALSNITQRWVTGQLSNFGYLMLLNTVAGRSYNDLTQYPVFPFVLADYVSSSIDLSNSGVFRDLSKPMGALAEDRAMEFRERYEDWPEEFPPPFHYGSHYSSSGIVLFYLVRLMPFTNVALQHQGGYFDKADRLFNDVSQVWSNASGVSERCRSLNEKGNLQDVRELIPEWYSLPAMFKNTNRFFLGRTQDGTNVHDVHLPPWAQNDPTMFVRILRSALESDYVSRHLHEWVDLIFGYAQKGQAAIDAQNVFYYMTYSGAVDVDTLKDKTIRAATISQIHNFGQTPIQLFKKPHPPRFDVEPSEGSEIDSTSQQMKVNIIDRPEWLQSRYPPSLANQPPFKQAISGFGWDGKLVVVDGQKCLIGPKHNLFVAWGFPDYGVRLFSTKEREGVLNAWEFLHDAQISKVVVSDQGHLITGGHDTNVNVYSMSTTNLSFKASLCAHTGTITAMAVSSAFNLLITGDDGGTVILWDLVAFRLVRRLLAHPGSVAAIAIEDLFGDFATASEDWILLWDVNGEILTSMNTHWQAFSFSSLSSFWHQDSIEKHVDELSDSDDDDSRAPISPSNTSHYSQPSKVRYPPLLPPHVSLTNAITALTFGPVSDSAWLLVSGHGDGNICLWTLEFSSLVQRRGAPPPWPIALPNSMSAFSLASRVCCVPHVNLPVNRDLPVSSSTSQPNIEVKTNQRTEKFKDTSEPRGLSKTALLPSSMYLHLLYSLPSTTSDHKSAITSINCSSDHLWSGDINGIVNEWHIKQKLDQPKASNCAICDTHFTTTKRRHTCRKCCLTVCQKCSKHRTALPELGYTQLVRVCNECYALT